MPLLLFNWGSPRLPRLPREIFTPLNAFAFLFNWGMSMTACQVKFLSREIPKDSEAYFTGACQ
jgi:hypothetical protein